MKLVSVITCSRSLNSLIFLSLEVKKIKIFNKNYPLNFKRKCKLTALPLTITMH